MSGVPSKKRQRLTQEQEGTLQEFFRQKFAEGWARKDIVQSCEAMCGVPPYERTAMNDRISQWGLGKKSKPKLTTEELQAAVDTEVKRLGPTHGYRSTRDRLAVIF